MLVLDASGALQAALAAEGFRLFGDEELVAPDLMWSEATSALHELLWRGVVSSELADTARGALRTAPVSRRSPSSLRWEAWRVAEELGWMKTYDAEYVALAILLDCPLFTVDERLRRGAGRLVKIVGPENL